MNSLRTFFSITVAGLFLMACGNNDENNDVTKPVISDVEIHNSDQNAGSKVMAGAQAVVEFNLQDDQALSAWKVDIHDAFDGHGHGKIFHSFTPLSMVKSGQTGGNNANVEVDLGVLESEITAGEYHCIVNATDASGNSADVREVIFVVSNGKEPQITINSPAFGTMDHMHMDKGSSFTLEGTLTDDKGIVSFEIFLAEESAEHDHGKIAGESKELFHKDDFAADIVNFNLADAGSVVIPADLTAGDYELKFVAEDGDGNYMIEAFDIHIE